MHRVDDSRALPDLSADADPFSGYLAYGPATTTTAMGLGGGWGGTSFVGPQLNGATAVIESVLHHRVGFWNPSIYSFAKQKSSPFTTLDQSGTQNDNLFYTGTPGTVYNPASGLGVPNLAALASDFGAALRGQTPHGGVRGNPPGTGNPRGHGHGGSPPHG